MLLTCHAVLRLAPLNWFKPSSKIFYWPFQGGTSFVDLLCFCSVLCLLCFVRVCLYVLRGHLLGKGWPLGSRLWCLLWVCHFPIGILGQVWYLIVSIPDLCNLTYFGCNEQRIYRLQTRFRQPGSKIDKPPLGRPRITTPLEVRIIVTSTWRNRFMAAWELLKHLRHASCTKISVFTSRNRLRGARLIFEFWNFEFWCWPLCVILMKKMGIVSEYFVENVHVCKTLNEFHVE